MKKLLLIAFIVLGFSSNLMAQKDTVKSHVINSVVTIDTLSAKIDGFIRSQAETNDRIEKKVNQALARVNNINSRSVSWSRIVDDLIPIMVISIIGLFIIFVIFIFGKSRYNNNRLKYDTMMQCIDKTGSVPDYFNKVERQRAASIPSAGRVHLVLSLICGIIGTLFLICAINYGGFWGSVACGGVGACFAMGAVVLFTQFNKISESSRSNQE